MCRLRVEADADRLGPETGLYTPGYGSYQGVEHDDMNVIVLALGVIGCEAQDAVEVFSSAVFGGEKPLIRRSIKVKGIENDEFR